MTEITKYAPGTPSWVDLRRARCRRGGAFLQRAVRVEVTEAGPVEETGGYRMCTLRGQSVAGLGPQMDPSGTWWTSYVTVDDADATAKVIASAGGKAIMDPMDVFTVGRMAVFTDPAGAAFAVWQPGDHIGAGIVNEPGTLTWNELWTRDEAASAPFYATVFGWKAEAHEMGPMTDTGVPSRRLDHRRHPRGCLIEADSPAQPARLRRRHRPRRQRGRARASAALS